MATNAPAAAATQPGTRDLAIGPEGAQFILRQRLVPVGAGDPRACALAAALALDPRALAALGDAEPIPSAPHPVVYLDTETSSLGGGAGVLVFLVGLARPVAGGLLVEQWLLRDLPAERAMLEALARRLAGAALLGSYAGRGFDAPRLEDRFRFHGLRWPLARAAHADLLPAARALWAGRLEACTLQALERSVLGYARSADLPGALCPAAFFGWLRGGARALAPIEPVLQHNEDDLVSLACLAAEAAARAERLDHPAEVLGLARFHRRRRRFGEALRLLEHVAVLDEGSAGAPRLTHAERLTHWAELGLARRALGDLRGAARAWAELLDDPEPPFRTLVALARLAEHRLLDLALAERAAVAALAAVLRPGRALPPERRARLVLELDHRLRRLAAKRRRRGPAA